jgi:rSAM/selenodomain-associated transferase 2
MSKISIIIPTYNEAETISVLLQHLITHSTAKHIADIIVVDGGSTDATLKNATAVNGVTCISSPKGRAKQMNIGAAHAKGSVLYFLHADSYPPKDFDHYILSQLRKGNQAGCFRMRFNSNHWWLKLAGWLTALPIMASRGGDQSLFITQSLFANIGGYDEAFLIYEDNDFIKKLYTRKQFVVIQKWLTTSARCYKKHGVWKTQYYFWRIHLKRKLGASPAELTAYYSKKFVSPKPSS